jgi:dTDP-4-amino-4,6-dideoxygalactose transaminase
MAIPFFSIDFKKKDLLILLLAIIFPFNKKKKERNFLDKLSLRFPKKNICLLPSARLGFYLTLKKFFKEDDEIIFSSMSFPLYIKIANQLKLKVVLIDVEKDTLNINPAKIESKINKKTKGIVATHLFGYPCKIQEISFLAKKYNLKLIEDCAQSFNSFYKNQETGTFGDVGIFSTSLLKIPTTLGGGILITDDKKLKIEIDQWCKENLKNNISINLKLFVKNLLSILNSYPLIYSILSDKIFNFLNKYNPRIYRKILYSGMGISKGEFDPLERPKLRKYQIVSGILQLQRSDEMNFIRKKNSIKLIKSLENKIHIKTLSSYNQHNWNYQYHVLILDENLNLFSKKLFNEGVHAMEENVWDCTNYDFKIENQNDNFENTKKFNPKLIRIQNNSYLGDKHIKKIIKSLDVAS